jgi:hypothetical protein
MSEEERKMAEEEDIRMRQTYNMEENVPDYRRMRVAALSYYASPSLSFSYSLAHFPPCYMSASS